MSSHHHTKLVHEGRYAAEVEVEFIDTDTGWSPTSRYRMRRNLTKCVGL